jgi:NAD(P)-dependent dehydrogenase (short-subunit alcohol dehydrogenase family)
MFTVLITGANRGLGLEFTRQYAAQGWRVLACCREPETAHALQGIAAAHPQVTLYRLDVADFAQIDHLAQTLQDQAIDVLLSNAGVYGDKQDYAFGQLDYAVWEQTLRINTLAPVKLAEAFLPQLQKSQKRLLVPVSSLMASLADNSSGGSLCYRSSKAALNAAMKSLAIDLRPQQIGVLILHPGWVKTDMGGIHAPTMPEESVAGMCRVIDHFTLEKSGHFINFRGETLPW